MSSRLFLAWIYAALAANLLFSSACTDSSTGPASPAVSSIRILSANAELMLGASDTLIAIPLAADGRTLATRPVAFVSLTPSIVTVTSAGIVTAIGVGAGSIAVNAERATVTVPVTVLPLPTEAIVLSADTILLEPGALAAVTAIVRNSLGQDFPERGIAWTALNPDIARREAGGIRGMADGIARFRVTSDTLEAELTVIVRTPVGADLLFSEILSGESLPRIFRTDLAGSPVDVFPLFAAPGAWHPVPSPDGSRLAFACQSTHGPTICLADADGSDVTELLGSDAYTEDQPSWSPDGARIAFRRQAHGASSPYNPTDIWTVRVDGSELVNVTADAQSQHWPTWSPRPLDGAYRIAFVQDSVMEGYLTSRIHTMRADGGDRRAETPLGLKVEGRAMWSPDAAALVLSRSGEGAMDELFVVSVGAMAERLLLPERLLGGQAYPAWSPDGRLIAFTSQHEAVGLSVLPQIYTVRVDGTGLVRRTEGGTGKADLIWRPRP